MASPKLHALPENLGLDIAALVEPLAVAWHAIKKVDLLIHKSNILIVGGGPIGYALALGLKAQGAARVLISEPPLQRRRQVEPLVDRVTDPLFEDVREVCKDLTNGKGIDRCLRCRLRPSWT